MLFHFHIWFGVAPWQLEELVQALSDKGTAMYNFLLDFAVDFFKGSLFYSLIGAFHFGGHGHDLKLPTPSDSSTTYRR